MSEGDRAARLSHLGTVAEPRLAVVIDCADSGELAAFWTRALGYTVVHAGEPYTVLAHPSADRPELVLQRVDEPERGENRVHLDLLVDDLDAAAERMEGLGARRRRDETLRYEGHRWYVYADPEGNEFCLVSDEPS